MKRNLLKSEIGVTDMELSKRLFTSLVLKTKDKIASETESLTKDDREKELVLLPTHVIKGMYTLKLLEAREYRLQISDMLNIYRSIQRRITIDTKDAGIKHKVQPETETIDPSERESGFDEYEKRTEHPAGIKLKQGSRASTVSATCPILPSVHSLHMRALECEPTTFHGLAQRRDKIEVTDEGMYVIDEFGINITYDAVKADYAALIQEL